MNDERIRALALVRASITEDGETLAAILAEPVGVELVRHVAAVAAITMESTTGAEQALRIIDHLMALTIAEGPYARTRAREGDE